MTMSSKQDSQKVQETTIFNDVGSNQSFDNQAHQYASNADNGGNNNPHHLTGFDANSGAPAPNNSDFVFFKAFFKNDETRIFQLVRASVSFAQLMDKLMLVFPFAKKDLESQLLAIYFKDVDGDLVRLTCDMDLMVAVSDASVLCAREYRAFTTVKVMIVDAPKFDLPFAVEQQQQQQQVAKETVSSPPSAPSAPVAVDKKQERADAKKKLQDDKKAAKEALVADKLAKKEAAVAEKKLLQEAKLADKKAAQADKEAAKSKAKKAVKEESSGSDSENDKKKKNKDKKKKSKKETDSEEEEQKEDLRIKLKNANKLPAEITRIVIAGEELMNYALFSKALKAHLKTVAAAAAKAKQQAAKKPVPAPNKAAAKASPAPAPAPAVQAAPSPAPAQAVTEAHVAKHCLTTVATLLKFASSKVTIEVVFTGARNSDANKKAAAFATVLESANCATVAVRFIEPASADAPKLTIKKWFAEQKLDNTVLYMSDEKDLTKCLKAVKHSKLKQLIKMAWNNSKSKHDKLKQWFEADMCKL